MCFLLFNVLASYVEVHICCTLEATASALLLFYSFSFFQPGSPILFECNEDPVASMASKRLTGQFLSALIIFVNFQFLLFLKCCDLIMHSTGVEPYIFSQSVNTDQSKF